MYCIFLRKQTFDCFISENVSRSKAADMDVYDRNSTVILNMHLIFMNNDGKSLEAAHVMILLFPTK